MAEATSRARPWQPASWSDLPWDLAGRVLCLLQDFADRARFAAVCPQWRAAARELPLPPPLPLLALPDGTFHTLPDGKPFRFPGFGCAGFKTAACGRWLVFPRDDGCFLIDPFARSTVELPPLSRVRLRPPNAVVKYPTDEDGKRLPAFSTWMHLTEQNRATVVKKLVLCSPNLVAAFIGTGSTNQILICQPGASSWSVRAYDKCKNFEDMAFFQGKLYALADNDNESLLVVGISQDPSTGDPQVCRVRHVIRSDPDHFFEALMPDNTTARKKLYLVESCGKLLMVRRKVCLWIENGMVMADRLNEFEVMEADLERLCWVSVSTLGDDRVLFLGRACSRVVSASQYGLLPDQIFFLDDVTENFVEYYYDEEDTSVGVYNMLTGEISSPLPMVWKHDMIAATWLFPQMI